MNRPQRFFYFILIPLSFIFYPSIIYAKEIGSLNTSYSIGEKSQTDDIEDRDLSGDFHFYKYGVNLKAKSEKELSYRMVLPTIKKSLKPDTRI